MAFSTEIFGPNTGTSIADRRKVVGTEQSNAEKGRGGDSMMVRHSPFTIKLLQDIAERARLIQKRECLSSITLTMLSKKPSRNSTTRIRRCLKFSIQRLRRTMAKPSWSSVL